MATDDYDALGGLNKYLQADPLEIFRQTVDVNAVIPNGEEEKTEEIDWDDLEKKFGVEPHNRRRSQRLTTKKTKSPPKKPKASTEIHPDNIPSGSSSTGPRGKKGRKRRPAAATNAAEIPNGANNNVLGTTSSSSNVLDSNAMVMRSRRNQIAERAARCPTVDVVDLVTSPLPPITGLVNLDSDEEQETENTNRNQVTDVCPSSSQDCSFDEDNPVLSVKVSWKGEPEAFDMRKYQKFKDIFKQFAERENTSVENVVLNLNDRIITENDTPASINYKNYQFIRGRVVISQVANATKMSYKKRDPNKIQLRVQSDRWKRPLVVDILKSDKLKILYIKCGEELNVPYNTLKLSFDGELLEYDATPTDAELEGGEMIDLRFK